jgi:hypothetical protein
VKRILEDERIGIARMRMRMRMRRMVVGWAGGELTDCWVPFCWVLRVGERRERLVLRGMWCG